MDHSEAVKTKAVERYLLRELTGDERNAFEEHYFSCQVCAEEVRCGAVLMDNLGEVIRSTPVTAAATRASSRHGFSFQWLFPAFAVAVVLLAAIVGYQNLVVIPRLRTEVSVAVPQVLTSVSLMSSVSRGGPLPVVNVKSSEPFGLYLDIPPQSGVSAFQCEVRSGSEPNFAVRVSARQASETVHLLIPGGTLAPGRYDLVVSGISPGGTSSSAVEVIRYSFQVENRQ